VIGLDAVLQLSRERRQLPPPQDRRLIRERAKLTQAEVASAVGVKPPSICRWEKGERMPTGPRLRAYAALLKLLTDQTT